MDSQDPNSPDYRIDRSWSRRDFFRLGLGSTAAVAVAATVTGETLFAPSAWGETAPGAPDDGQHLTDEEVDAAIDRFKKHLFKRQQADGSYHCPYPEVHGKANGPAYHGGTAMATLALMVAGESMQSPAVEKALNLMCADGFVSRNVYETSLINHIWSYLPHSSYLPYEDLMIRYTKAIIQSQSGPGFWDEYETVWSAPAGKQYAVYSFGHVGSHSMSLSQYAILGLWQSTKRGISVPTGVWQDILKAWLGEQKTDGGWVYRRGQPTTQKMTCAGLTVLTVCQQMLYRNRSKPEPVITTAINRGLAYLDKNFSLSTAGTILPQLTGYQYYGYERVGLACGRKWFGGQDWFRAIGADIVRVGPDGNNVNDAYRLMFLARGRNPVWCNKIELPGAAWNNRPNDIYFANEWLSEMTKGELNWVTVDIGTTSDRWLSAPVAYLSVDGPVPLDAKQEENLRHYADHGGILVFNCENGAAHAWAKSLVGRMYPDRILGKPLAEGMLADDFPDGVIPGVQTVHNGARDLVVVQKDFGMKWQAEEKPNYNTPHWRFLFNLYRVATDRGHRVNRLASPFEMPGRARSGEAIKVVIPKYAGNSQPENKPYDIMDIYVGNRTGAKVVVDMNTPLAQLANSDAALAHIMGTDFAVLTPDEIKAIKDFVAKGGTVLAETVGGHCGKQGLFASSLVEPLQNAFGVDGSGQTASVAQAGQLADGSPLLTGREFKALSDHSAVDRPLFRQASVERGLKDHRIRVKAITVKDKDGKEREGVLFSDEDLTCGMNRVRTYGVNGYAPDTAQKFMLNVLLQADQGRKAAG